MTDLDKIFAEGISHYGLLPRKISSKSEHFEYQKLSAKIQNSGKKNQKSSLSRDIAMIWQAPMNHGQKFL